MRWILPSSWVNSSSVVLQIISLLMSPGLMCAQSPGPPGAGMFSATRVGENIPAGWQRLTFNRIERHADIPWWKRVEQLLSRPSVIRLLRD